MREIDKKRIERAANVGMAVLMVLNFIALATMIFVFFKTNELPIILTNLITVIMSLAVIFYGIYGYKIPHGNLIRYLILLFAVILAASIYINQGISKVTLAFSLAACVLSAYAAGKLGKPGKAALLFFIVTVLLVAIVFSEMLAPIPQGIENLPGTVDAAKTAASALPPAGEASPIGASLIFNISRALLWITIGITYIYRYDDHKDAGKTAQSEDE